jgi:hypothetical protein
MFGFFIGTACLIGFIVTLSRARRACGYGGCGGSGRRGFGGFGGHERHERHGWGGDGGGWDEDGPRRSRRGSWFLRGLFEQLETTPGQERVVVEAVEELREAARKVRGEGRQTMEDVGKAMKSPVFDEALFGDLFSRHDVALEGVRKAFVGAAAKIHDVLDEQQRERFARLVSSGRFAPFWAR